MKMYLAGVMMIIAFSVQSQIVVGTKAGISNSHIDFGGVIGDFLPGTSSFNGISAGVFVDLPLSKRFSISPEFLYTAKGSMYNPNTSIGVLGTDIPVGIKVTNRVNYFEAPILLKYKHRVGPFNLIAESGVNLAYAKSASLREEATVLFDFGIAEQNIDMNSSFVNRFDTGAILGLGADYEVSNDILLGANFRYNHSFRDFIDLDAAADAKNRGISMYITAAKVF